jgi:glycosyltransferase involved in cell wall biosynthesis/predicted O-methyltransferase YrrM
MKREMISFPMQEILSVEGMISPEEAQLLFDLASRASEVCIVEVGSWRGRSTVALALGSQHGENVPVYAVEPHEDFIGVRGGRFGPQDRVEFFKNMLRTNCAETVRLINAGSAVVSKGWDKPVSLLWIDGDHRYESVKRDFECWEPFIVKNGLVAFHDSLDDSLGPAWVIQEALRSGGYVKVDQVGLTTVLQKVVQDQKTLSRTTNQFSLKQETVSFPEVSFDPAVESVRGQTTNTKRLLIAWFRYTVNGAIGRFVNVAKVLRGFGHEVGFVSLTGETYSDWPEFPGPIMTMRETVEQAWDAVMIPGAGADDQMLRRLEVLKDQRFGIRVQHILNDVSLYQRFELVNKIFSPHIVIVNNSRWQTKDFRRLSAEAFHILPGAVDTELFFPSPLKTAPCSPPTWAIGGFASKNLEPLLDAISLLPENYILHLYGHVPPHLVERVSCLQNQGRVITYGPLFGKALAYFYRRMDIVVTTEKRAGWCNTAAEASACGVPCVVSPHGTVDFAENMGTALVLENITGEAIAESVTRLTSDLSLLAGIAQRAAARMRAFSWYSYCEKLLSILDQPRVNSYYRVPELGLWGKWEPATRIAGLNTVLDQCAGSTVLDLGAAEGVIGYFFAKNGIRLYHGFELEASRVEFARSILAQAPVPEFSFRQANLADWPSFLEQHGALLLESYDIVLFLGLYHHLPESTRMEALLGAMQKCDNWFVIRTPERVVREDDLVSLIESRGFTLVGQAAACQEENLGWLGLFKRREHA